MSVGEILFRIILGAWGLAVAFGILAFVHYRSAFRWRRLAEVYGDVTATSRVERHFETAILLGLGIAFQRYRGIVTVGVNDTGMTLRLLPIFSIFHRPLFIPFSEMSVLPHKWFLNDNFFAITTSRLPDLKLIVPSSFVHWIEENSGQQWESLNL